MGKEVWVYAEFNDATHFGLLNKAHSLATQLGGQACAVYSGELKNHEELIQNGADIIYHLPTGGSYYVKSHVLHDLCQKFNPEILLFPASTENSLIAASTAVLEKTGLTADCTDLDIDSFNQLRQTRPAFGGGLMADIFCADHRPQMATVKPGAFKETILNQKRSGSCINYTPEKYSDPVRIISSCETEIRSDLREASIIVAGGMGVGTREGFRRLSDFARDIGGMLGASRSAVETGFAHYSQQIGQTGTTVSPELYIAFGISGSSQHISGMNTARKVIAVNKNPMAQIFDYADIAIIGDWENTLDSIIEVLELSKLVK